MSKQRHRRRSQGGTTPETTPQTGSGVAQFSVSEVAQFSMSVDTQPSHRPDTYAAPLRRSSAQANPIAAAFNGPPRNQGQGSSGTRHSTTPAAIARPQAVPNSSSSGSRGSSTGDSSLDPATISNLQERIRALLPPQLAAFSRAFRTAFQVPDSTPSIAGLITEQRHRLWIEDFLGRLQSPQPQSHHRQARTA
jgi:hypothetical protein